MTIALAHSWFVLFGAAVQRRSMASLYQALVDRWIDLTAWGTAKKTALAMAVAAVAHSIVGMGLVFALRWAPGIVDLPLGVKCYAGWVAIIVVLFFLALLPARRGREGRWTVYAVIVLYGSCVIWFVMLFGSVTGPWLGILPLVVLLVPIYWDRTAGRFAFVFMVSAVALVAVLELTGRIRLAPAMLQRTLDGQKALGWYLTVYGAMLGVFSYVFALVQFSVAVRERQQRRLEAAHRELEAVSRHKSEFLANMSHELRTPLNAVIGFSEVLQARMFGALNEKQAEYVDDIQQSGRHLLSLINDILDLAKIEAGRLELNPADFELVTAIDDAMLLINERALRKGLRLEREIAVDLGTVHADERKVKQVLLNLLSNAVKFTREGGTITVAASREADEVRIAVRDTGIGIAPEDQEIIFEEFRQVGGDYTRKQEGTGLGLALARRFVDLHGGRLWVESEPGRGSTFTFTLPVARRSLAIGRS